MPLPPEQRAELAGRSERELLLILLDRQHEQGVIMSRLDDAVTGYLTEVDTVVADLRDKLAKAQADDATAADVAADVEENIARIEAASAALRGETSPSPEQPVEGEPVEPSEDGTQTV